jgi:hypothetical protein
VGIADSWRRIGSCRSIIDFSGIAHSTLIMGEWSWVGVRLNPPHRGSIRVMRRDCAVRLFQSTNGTPACYVRAMGDPYCRRVPFVNIELKAISEYSCTSQGPARTRLDTCGAAPIESPLVRARLGGGSLIGASVVFDRPSGQLVFLLSSTPPPSPAA